MRKIIKIYLISLLALGSIFGIYFFASSYGDKITHPALTEQAAKLFNKAAEEKLSDQVIEWIKKGSIEEDTAPRWMNHFYDPIYKTALKDGIAVDIAKTAIEWAHNPISQTTPLIGKGDYSWESAIYYYQNGEKEKAYIALGHVLHLLEDMGVPAHTRDDGHGIAEEPYETWVDDYIKDNKTNFLNVVSANCQSLDQCFTDLAYYTNTNFFSKDTISHVKYALPTIDGEEIIKKNGEYNQYGYKLLGNKRIYLVKILRPLGIINKFKEPEFIIDNDPEIHQAYFENLAPKVVSYGAGLIKLFQDEVKREPAVKPMSWMESKINGTKSILVGIWEVGKGTAVAGYNVAKDTTVYVGNAAKNTAVAGYEKSKSIVEDELERDKKALAAAKNAITKTFTGAVEVAKSVKDAGLNKANNAAGSGVNVLTAGADKVINSGLNALTVSIDKTGKILGETAESIKQGNIKTINQENIKTTNQENNKTLKQENNKTTNQDPPSLKATKGKEVEKLVFEEYKADGSKENLTPAISLKERESNSFVESGAGELVKVKNVIDGDTIELEDGRKVRYIGIDTAELNKTGSEDDECLAWAARERNRILLEQSKEVKLVKDSGGDKDKYGRLLRYVYGNTLFLNEVLAREGMAKFFICESYMKNCPVMDDAARISKINNGVKEAKIAKRGLYSDVCEKIADNSKDKNEVGNKNENDLLADNNVDIFFGSESKTNNVNKFIPLPGGPSNPALPLSDGQNENDDSGTVSPPKEDDGTDQEKNGDEESDDQDEPEEPDEQPDEPKDLLPPITTVKDLASEQNSSFAVYWEGEDQGDVKSGIDFYDLMYQADGDWWFDLETETTATSIIFNIAAPDDDGKEICFQARATDKAGNVEDWEEAPHQVFPCALGGAANEQIKCTKINLTYPSRPIFDFPTDGMVITADAIAVTGTAELADIGKIVKVEINGNVYDALIQDNGIWTTDTPSLDKQGEKITLQKGTNAISAYVIEKDGDESEKVVINVNAEEEKLDEDDRLNVVINEIAWMGTADNANDEWIELYNNTGFPLDLNGWTLTAADGTPSIELTGGITSYGYYLIEHKKVADVSDETISDIVADKSYTGELLRNDGEFLKLIDNNDNVIDFFDCSDNLWFGKGDNKSVLNRKTMERIDPTKSGDDEQNWDSNDGITKNGKNRDGKDIFGTPKSINSAALNNNFLPNRMTVLPYMIDKDMILTPDKNPYSVFGETTVGEDVVLTIEKGVIIKTIQTGSLRIKGKLEVKGTKKWPVIFTSYNDDIYGGDTNRCNDQAEAGDWGWVSFEEGSKPSFIDNAIFQYGGVVFNVAFKGQIWVKSGDVKISNSSFSKIKHTGDHIVIDGGKVAISDSYFTSEKSSTFFTIDINIARFDELILNNIIFDNKGMGINYFAKIPVINAQNMWWGDPSGPLDINDDTESGGFYNPKGKGAQVTDGVDYSKWKVSLP